MAYDGDTDVDELEQDQDQDQDEEQQPERRGLLSHLASAMGIGGTAPIASAKTPPFIAPAQPQPSITGAAGPLAAPAPVPTSVTAQPLGGTQPIVPPVNAAEQRLQTLEADKPAVTKKHGLGGGILNTLDVLGSAIAPGITSRIPGTRGNYQRQIAELSGQATEQEKLNQERGLEQGAQAEIPLRQAETERAQAQTKAIQNPPIKEGLTPEEMTIHDLMTGQNGQPKINPQTKQPYSYLEAYQAVNQVKQDVKPDKETRFEHVAIQDPNKPGASIEANYNPATGKYTDASGKEISGARAFEKPEKPPGTYTPIFDPKTGAITGAWDPATGDVKPAPSSLHGATTGTGIGAQNRISEASQKQTKPFKDVISTTEEARDFAKEKTGPGDYGLLLRVVDATKPLTGFRFTKSEQDLLIGARSLANQADAMYQKAKGGVLLTDEQRGQMLRVLDIVEKNAQKRLADLSGGGKGPATSGKTYTDAEVQAAAKANGMKPEDIEAAYKAKGYQKQ